MLHKNYLVFQALYRYFKLNSIINVTDYVLSWKSKVSSAESITPPTTSDNRLTPSLSYYHNTKIKVKFNGIILRQSKKLSYTHGNIVNIYIVFSVGSLFFEVDAGCIYLKK